MYVYYVNCNIQHGCYCYYYYYYYYCYSLSHSLFLSFSLAAGRNDKERAADFFQGVKDTTSTLILWPSKLKIGDKSKKGLITELDIVCYPIG